MPSNDRYESISRVFEELQKNVNNYGSVKGRQSLFGIDEQQAREVAGRRSAAPDRLLIATA